MKNQPVRLVTKDKNGRRHVAYTGYSAIQKAAANGRLIAAYSVSTGKSIA